jgi:hypothetical protein
VIDAYGWVNVVSPAGLPVRSIVGIRPDPIMFLALNCVDVTKSEEFYAKLGFVRQVGCCMWLTCQLSFAQVYQVVSLLIRWQPFFPTKRRNNARL